MLLQQAKPDCILRSVFPYAVLSAIAVAFWAPAIFTDEFLIWSDASVYLNLQKDFDANYYAWYDGLDLGRPNFGSSHLPLIIPALLAGSAGVPLVLFNHAYMVLTIAVAGWTMYYILTRLLSSRLYALAGALVYMLAPIVTGGGLGGVAAVSYCVFPLFFYFTYRGLASGGGELRYACAAGLASIGAAIAPQVASLAIITGFLLAFGTAVAKRRVNVKFLAYAAAVGFAANSVWIIPFATDSDRTFSAFSTEATGHRLGDTSAATDLLFSARLMDLPHFGMVDLGPAGWIMWLVPIYCFSTVILAKRKLVYFVAALAAMSVLFSTGVRYPAVGQAYELLAGNVPYLFVPLQNLSDYLYLAAFSYAVLFGFTTQALARRARLSAVVYVRAIAASLAVALIVASSYPALVGEPFQEKTEAARGFAHVGKFHLPTLNHASGAGIPSSYLALAAGTLPPGDAESGYRLLVLPWQHGYAKFEWYSGADMVDIAHRVSPLSTLGYSNAPFLPPAQVDELRRVMLAGNLTSITELKDALGNLGVKYVLVHKDLEKGPPTNIKVSVSFTGEGSAYSVTQAAAASGSAYEQGSAIARALGGSVVQDGDAFTLFEVGGAKKVVTARLMDGGGEEGVEVKRRSPVLYTGVASGEAPFSLALGQKYDEGWRLRLDGAATEAGHFEDGHINGWDLPAGTHEFEIYYERQNVYTFAAILSLAAFLFAIGFLFSEWAKRLQSH